MMVAVSVVLSAFIRLLYHLLHGHEQFIVQWRTGWDFEPHIDDWHIFERIRSVPPNVLLQCLSLMYDKGKRGHRKSHGTD